MIPTRRHAAKSQNQESGGRLKPAMIARIPPLMEKDLGIAPFLPTRLELVDGKKLQQWLNMLVNQPYGIEPEK